MPPRTPRAPIISIDSGGHRARVLRRRDELVLAHTGMVPPIAQRIKERLPDSFEIADLIATGNLALVRAATRYRPRQHGWAPFTAFARPRVAGAIIDSIRRRHWTENTRERLPENFEVPFCDPFAEEAVAAIDEDRELCKDRYGRLVKPLAAALEQLTARERLVLGAYYAENCEDVAMVGGILGISAVRVTAEHDAAIAKLRARMLA